MAIVLPLVLLVDGWVRERRSSPARRLRALWPYGIALVVYLAARGLVLGASASPPVPWALYVPGGYLAFRDPAPGEVLLTMVHAFGEYVRLLVLPWSLSADYSGFPHATRITGPVALSGAVLVALAAAAVTAWRQRVREPAFWLAWIALTLFPVSNLVFVSGILLAERVLYLPSVAACALGGHLAEWLRARRRVLVVLPLLVVVLFAGKTVARTRIWTTERIYYEETWRHGRYAGHLSAIGVVKHLVLRYEASGDAALLAEAEPIARRAVALSSTVANVHYLAMILELEGKWEESLRWWDELRRQRPRDPVYREAVDRVRSRLARGGPPARE
jgi:hypothetical protein